MQLFFTSKNASCSTLLYFNKFAYIGDKLTNYNLYHLDECLWVMNNSWGHRRNRNMEILNKCVSRKLPLYYEGICPNLELKNYFKIKHKIHKLNIILRMILCLFNSTYIILKMLDDIDYFILFLINWRYR
jgi:hypothetical protein